MAYLDYTGITNLVTYLRSKFASLVGGVVAVSQGGTGKGTHTTNSVLAGDGTNAVKNVTTKSGALYATAANGAATFGKLPIAQGGTAGTTKVEARTSLEVPVNSSIAYVESVTAKTNHAVGDYFMLGDTLMKATSAIATGETISASNAVLATIQSQIDILRDLLSPNSMTVELYGNVLVGVVSVDGTGRSLYVAVSKPYGKTFNNVSFDSSATFDLVGIAGATKLTNVSIRSVVFEKQTSSDTTVLLQIEIQGGAVSDGAIYRPSWSVPKLTLT